MEDILPRNKAKIVAIAYDYLNWDHIHYFHGISHHLTFQVYSRVDFCLCCCFFRSIIIFRRTIIYFKYCFLTNVPSSLNFTNQEIRYNLRIHFLFYKQTFLTQPAFTCSKLTIETLEQGVKYVQS